MSTNLLKSRRAEFWTAFSLIAAVCFALAISGRIRRYNAGQSAETLRQLLAVDARFAKVQVHGSTNAHVWLDGEVASADDLAALHRLVQQAHVPTQPGILVRVVSPAPNKPVAGNARSAPQFAIVCQWPGVPDPGR